MLTAIIWGLAFVAQSEGLRNVGTYTFCTARSWLAFITLAITVLITDAVKKKKPKAEPVSYRKGDLLKGGIACGLALFTATIIQQNGIMLTSVGKSGFITALYILFVPIFGLFLKKKVTPLLWVSVVIALTGMYFLCMSGNSELNKGDMYILICAVLFSVHILCVDRFANRVDGVKLSCFQFGVCAVLSTICMFIFEKPVMSDIINAAIPIVYAGVFSSGVAFTLQIVAQKDAPPTVTTLIMSLESVFAALFGWLILEESLSAKELCGCALVFAAIILCQLPIKKREKKSAARAKDSTDDVTESENKMAENY